jgi:hypothetical protein
MLWGVVEPLPKWVMQRYAALWKEFEVLEFSHADAVRVLGGDSMLAIVLSQLRKAGWLRVSLDKKDARKRVYVLVHPEDAVGGMST